MSKDAFREVNSKGYVEPEGNAFSGSVEAYDREMYAALRNADMSGDENPSIANASLRMAQNTEDGGRRKGANNRGTSTLDIFVINQLTTSLNNIDQRIGVLNDHLLIVQNILDNDEVMEAESYEDLSEEARRAYDAFEDVAVERGHSRNEFREQFFGGDRAGRSRIGRDIQEGIETDIADLGELRTQVQNLIDENYDEDVVLTEPFSVENNMFTNPLLEAAAQRWEAVPGNDELDRHNISIDVLRDLLVFLNEDIGAEVGNSVEVASALEMDSDVQDTLTLGAGLTFQT